MDLKFEELEWMDKNLSFLWMLLDFNCILEFNDKTSILSSFNKLDI
jgi:hypothetical protein